MTPSNNPVKPLLRFQRINNVIVPRKNANENESDFAINPHSRIGNSSGGDTASFNTTFQCLLSASNPFSHTVITSRTSGPTTTPMCETPGNSEISALT